MKGGSTPPEYVILIDVLGDGQECDMSPIYLMI